MRSKHWLPKKQFIIVVTRDGKNHFFYGCTRKEAMDTGGIKPGEIFTSQRYDGAGKTVCERSTNGKSVKEYI